MLSNVSTLQGFQWHFFKCRFIGKTRGREYRRREHECWRQELLGRVRWPTRKFLKLDCMSYTSEQNKAQLYPALLTKYKIIWFIYTSENNYFVWKCRTLHSKQPDVTSGLRPRTKPLLCLKIEFCFRFKILAIELLTRAIFDVLTNVR